MTCPKCHSARHAVRETRHCVNGTKRRRIECSDCYHRWTEWDGPRPPRRSDGVTRRPKANRKRLWLTEAQVRMVLTQPEVNNQQMAKLLDCSGETIRQIRCGRLYRNVLPHLIRPKEERPRLLPDGPRCDHCEHWRPGVCSFGFPDPIMEGLGFAADCEVYRPAIERSPTHELPTRTPARETSPPSSCAPCGCCT